VNEGAINSFRGGRKSKQTSEDGMVAKRCSRARSRKKTSPERSSCSKLPAQSALFTS